MPWSAIQPWDLAARLLCQKRVLHATVGDFFLRSKRREEPQRVDALAFGGQRPCHSGWMDLLLIKIRPTAEECADGNHPVVAPGRPSTQGCLGTPKPVDARVPRTRSAVGNKLYRLSLNSGAKSDRGEIPPGPDLVLRESRPGQPMLIRHPPPGSEVSALPLSCCRGRSAAHFTGFVVRAVCSGPPGGDYRIFRALSSLRTWASPHVRLQVDALLTSDQADRTRSGPFRPDQTLTRPSKRSVETGSAT
jgi:hypothetical protein